MLLYGKTSAMKTKDCMRSPISIPLNGNKIPVIKCYLRCLVWSFLNISQPASQSVIRFEFCIRRAHNAPSSFMKKSIVEPMQSTWWVFGFCVSFEYSRFPLKRIDRELIMLLEHRNCSYSVTGATAAASFQSTWYFFKVLWNANAFSSAVPWQCFCLV